MSDESNVSEDVPESVPNRERKVGNMENCPIPPEHVRTYEECCDKYAKGEMSDLDVLGEVIGTLKKLRSVQP